MLHEPVTLSSVNDNSLLTKMIKLKLVGVQSDTKLIAHAGMAIIKKVCVQVYVLGMLLHDDYCSDMTRWIYWQYDNHKNGYCYTCDNNLFFLPLFPRQFLEKFRYLFDGSCTNFDYRFDVEIVFNTADAVILDGPVDGVTVEFEICN